MPDEKIIVIGVGGCGVKIIDYLLESGVKGVELVAADTDSKTLGSSHAHNKILLGENLLHGSGTSGNDQAGINSAKESIDEIKECIKDSDMVFIAAGIGRGTGSGAAPVIAEAARDMGILTVGIVTKPFAFEMGVSMRLGAINIMRRNVDAILVIENDRVLLSESTGNKITLAEVHSKIYEVVLQAVKCVTDIINSNGFVKIDFSDVRAVLTNAGRTIIGFGECGGGDRIRKALLNAIDSPLMSLPVKGAAGVLVNITTGDRVKMSEFADVQKILDDITDPEAFVTLGHAIDESLGEKVRVSIIAAFGGI